MAVIRGEQGSVHFDPAGGAKSGIVGTRSWTLNVTKETLDITRQGDTHRRFTGGLVSGSGTVEFVYDPDAAGQAEFIEEAGLSGTSADAVFELFTTGTTSGVDSITFFGIVTSLDLTSTVGELTIATCNFITSDGITLNLE